MPVAIKNAYRFLTVESERGWKTEYDYLYYETEEQAVERHKALQPIPNIATPEYYFIAAGPVEKIDERGNWNKI